MTLKSPWRSIQAVRRRHDLAYGGAAAAPGVTFYLLKEDGDALLKEDGDNILKEDAP